MVAKYLAQVGPRAAEAGAKVIFGEDIFGQDRLSGLKGDATSLAKVVVGGLHLYNNKPHQSKAPCDLSAKGTNLGCDLFRS